MSQIKISELDPIPSSPTIDDFMPIVDSGSLTTYRANLYDIGVALKLGNI
jgi:hypothetical protein